MDKEHNEVVTDIADILEADPMFDAFMRQLVALQQTVSAYIDLTPNILEVPNYLLTRHDGIEDLVGYVISDIEEMLEEYEETEDSEDGYEK